MLVCSIVSCIVSRVQKGNSSLNSKQLLVLFLWHMFVFSACFIPQHNRPMSPFQRNEGKINQKMHCFDSWFVKTAKWRQLCQNIGLKITDFSVNNLTTKLNRKQLDHLRMKHTAWQCEIVSIASCTMFLVLSVYWGVMSLLVLHPALFFLKAKLSKAAFPVVLFKDLFLWAYHFLRHIFLHMTTLQKIVLISIFVLLSSV